MERLRKDNDRTILELELHDKPNYYSILPAKVRYDDGLSWFEKVLYAEITALSNKLGYCYAPNSYFSGNFSISDKTVTRAVKNLNVKGLIFVLYEASGGKTFRKIYLGEVAEREIPGAVAAQKSSKTGTMVSTEKPHVEDKNVPYDGQKCPTNSMKYNSMNNTSINTPPSEGTNCLPSWMGKTAHVRLGKLYELLWEERMGLPTTLKLVGLTGGLLKNILDKHSEMLTALLMVVHFEWRGITGNDESANRHLKSNGYPLAWLPKNIDLYLVFILKTMGLDSEEKQEKAVTGAIDQLVKKLS